MWTLIFFTSLFLLFYTYVGYGMLIAFLNLFRKSRIAGSFPEKWPHVTMVVAAFNEIECIEEKITNSLQLDYPADKLHLLIVSDGSNDGTDTIISKYVQVQLLHRQQRLGKTAALNRAMEFVTSPIVIFSDANALLNKEAVRFIVRHFEDPLVGGVAGEKKIIDSGSLVGKSEGVYWRYESLMKQLDAEFNTGIGAAGELFAMRTILYSPLSENILLDDFVQSIRLLLKGYRLAYEPNAYAFEGPSLSFAEEWKRKVRIAAGAWQTMFLYPSLFAFWKHPLISFQFISRRFFRWVLCPLALMSIFISNYFLWQTGGHFYVAAWWMQLVFYASAFTGWMYQYSGRPGWWWLLPFYFIFTNIAQLAGAIAWLSGSQKATWTKAKRFRGS